VVTVLVVGCAGNTLKLGSDGDAGDNSAITATGGASAVDCTGTTAGPALPQWLAPDACVTGNENAAIVGEWVGYYQGTSIDDESSTFRLKILGANATKGVCGTLTFGAHTAAIAMPVATNPATVPAETALGSVMLGAPYTLLDGALDGQRVTFSYSQPEVYKSWCELQTSYPTDNSCTRFQCLSSSSSIERESAGVCYLTNQDGSNKHSYSCLGIDICVMYSASGCVCNATGCTAVMSGSGVLFDLTFTGDQATGVSTAATGNRTVIFNRVTTTQ
jgi:hypothetical protein